MPGLGRFNTLGKPQRVVVSLMLAMTMTLMGVIAYAEEPSKQPIQKPEGPAQPLTLSPTPTTTPAEPATTTPLLKKTIQKTVQPTQTKATKKTKKAPMPQAPEPMAMPTLEVLRFNEVTSIKDPKTKLMKLAAFERDFPNSIYQKYVDELTINARWDRYLEAQQEHLYDEAYQLGELLLPNMTGTPQELLVLVSQAKMAGYEAFDGDPQWLVSGSDYANQAVGLLEQGHQLDSDPSRWLRQQPILMGQMYRTIGLAHANEGRWAEAEQAYMRVLSYDCGDPTAYYLLGQMSDTQYQAVAKAYNDLKQKNDENATLQFAQARDLARKTLNHFAQAYQATIVHRNAPSFTRLKLSSLQKMHQLQPIVFYVEPKVVKDKKGRTKLVPQRQPSFDSYLKTLPGICPKQATE